jgi:uncharacterized RDD family membrane protein YckC
MPADRDRSWHLIRERKLSMVFADDEINPYAAPKRAPGPSTAPKKKFRGYASIWSRFVARIIDAVVLFVFGAVLGGVLGFVGAAAGMELGAIRIMAQVAGWVLGLSYYAGMTSSESQATLGKKAMGIKVTDLKGRRISFGRALGRELATILSVLILFIGYLMAFFTERKQALHDMVAGTLVVKAA